MSNAYGFQQTPENPSAPNTVNATQRQEKAENLKTTVIEMGREINRLKDAVEMLTKDSKDLQKAVDQLTIDVYRKK